MHVLINPILQVSMLDINEKQGVTSCTDLQKEFSPDDVMFTKVDVVERQQLVIMSVFTCTLMINHASKPIS